MRTVSTTIPLAHAIPPVSLCVAKAPHLPGRVERYQSAKILMQRLVRIGQRRLVITSMSEGGSTLPELEVDALNHYLWFRFGPHYWCRTAHWCDAEGWAHLKGVVGLAPLSRFHVQ